MKKDNHSFSNHSKAGGQRGASLVVVLIVLTIVSMLGVAGIQISMMSERGARNDRDQQLAWQSAEAALADAEIDIWADNTASATSRQTIFRPATDITMFVLGCGSTGNKRGLCTPDPVSGTKPIWQSVDFEDESSSAPTTAYGTFTSRVFTAGSAGIQPAAAPRYIVEAIRDPGDRDLGSSEANYVYRVTAMGFGPRKEVQAVIQMIYRD